MSLKGAAEKSITSPAARVIARTVATVVPILLVNAVAFVAQYGYLRDHLPWTFPAVAAAAAALESVSIYVQWHSHLAMLADDTYLGKRIASYLLALVIGAMNYSHFAAPHWHPTVPAVMCGLFSLISPWLWGVHSKRVSRDKLMARSLVDPHAVRLGASRWLFHPYRSLLVHRHATWTGTNNPRVAMAAFAHKRWDVPRSARGTGTPDGPVAQSAPDEPPAPGDAPVTVPPIAPVVIPAPVVPAAAVPPVQDEPPVQRASAPAPRAGRPRRIPRPLIEAAEQKLAKLDADALPSIREVARWLGDENQRRLAKKLLADRVSQAAAPQPPAPQAPRAEGNGHSARPQQMISWPAQFSPGGARP